ncbi:LysM peptidoglycan-binding domain-containing protein [Ornithinimicrobium sp. LYQ92]|uniref:LysM peptidoglycan-binding domain-containing protein n=1 Tax=Serinicoccus sp. LYQ92 TaxID=3378798 RepID=UPI0038553A46
MSPLFAALPPGDLPTNAYVAPTGVHATAPIATDLVMAPKTRSHTVVPGETVYGIADRYDVAPQDIVRANKLSQGGRWILPGATLRIPGSGATDTGAESSSRPSSSERRGAGTVTVRAGDTLSHLAVRHGVSVNALVSANSLTNSRLIYPDQVLTLPGKDGAGSRPASSPASSSASGSQQSSADRSSSSGSTTVTVRNGDTLWGLATDRGVSVSALAGANDLSSSAMIYPGQTLRLPGTGSGGSADTTSSGRGSGASTSSGTLERPYDESTIGDIKAGEEVLDTFLHYRYTDGIARSAAANRDYLSGVDAPSQDRVKEMITETSRRHGVDPSLMLALSYQESGWNHRAVSPANAIGAMQVIPSSGEWASSLVGRELNLLDPQDNVTAGVVIMRALQRSADSSDEAIGGYYQGLASVRQHGLFPDTEQYVGNIKRLMSTQ